MKMTSKDYSILEREIKKVIRNRSNKKVSSIKAFRKSKTTFEVFCSSMFKAIKKMARFKMTRIISCNNLPEFIEENKEFNDMIKKYNDNHINTALKRILKNYK